MVGILESSKKWVVSESYPQTKSAVPTLRPLARRMSAVPSGSKKNVVMVTVQTHTLMKKAVPASQKGGKRAGPYSNYRAFGM